MAVEKAVLPPARCVGSALRPPCEAPTNAPATTSPRHPVLVLTVSILASSLAFVDGSVVNVGLPAIRAALRADPAALQWVVNAYLLPLSALLLLGGAVGDRLGRRATLVGGVSAFAAASALCAAANSLPVLLLARALQGTASAFILPSSLAILGASFSGAARGRAIGIWAAVGAAVGAVGPVLGGWLIDQYGWRTVFLINLPLALAAVGLAFAAVREVRPKAPGPRLDLLGSLLATAGLGLVAWSLTMASGIAGWGAQSLLALLLGLVLLTVFVRTEASRGTQAAMPLSLFSSGTFVGLTLLTLLVYGALSALFVLVPYVLIEARGYSATAAGAALLPLPIVLALLSPLAGGLVTRLGTKALLTTGSLLVGAGFLLLLYDPASNAYGRVMLPSLILIAVGMSGVAAPLTTAVLSSAGANSAGAASGFNSAISRVGGTFATALLGGVLGASGPALMHGFHLSMLGGAAACFVSAALALLLIRD